MAESLTEMAKDLVAALIENNLIASGDVQQKLREVHASLLGLKASETRAASGASGEGDTDALQTKDWRKSIRKYTVECLVCGQTFKQLSARHLRKHDLDPRTYRQQFGIPHTQPLAAKETTALRRRLVRENRPWEKAAANRKAQEEQAPLPAPSKRTRKKAATTG